MCEMFEGYDGREYFFLPASGNEAVASERLPQKLQAKCVKDALAEAKKHGHGIVVMKMGEV
jgi:hypothetical protein